MCHRHPIASALAGMLLSLVPTLSLHADVTHLPDGQKSLEFVVVGDPGNAPDDRPKQANGVDHTQGVAEWRANGSGPCGSVAYEYLMGKYIVTSAQYAAFLNAVARDDTYQLWNSKMGQPPSLAADALGSITRTGTPGAYSYAVRSGRENMPAVGVSWGSAARFANWLSNGQPAGAQGDATTEGSSYTLHGTTDSQGLTRIKRNPDAVFVIPNVDEWYKAAYYKGHGLNAGYWSYPTCSDSPPSNVLSATGTNNANYYNNGMTDPDNGITPVGAFAASPGPYGTFDQGGNYWQWDEAVFNATARGVRSGAYGRYGTADGYGGDMLYGPYYFWWFDANTGVSFRVVKLLKLGEKPDPAAAIGPAAATTAAPVAVTGSVGQSSPSTNLFLWLFGIAVAVIGLLLVIILLLVLARARVPQETQ